MNNIRSKYARFKTKVRLEKLACQVLGTLFYLFRKFDQSMYMSMSELEDKILKHSPFDILEPHMRRRAVFVVRNKTLLEVGEAIKDDSSNEVTNWLEDGTLTRPTIDEVIRWHDKQTSFTVLIVQPFVLVKEEFDA